MELAGAQAETGNVDGDVGRSNGQAASAGNSPCSHMGIQDADYQAYREGKLTEGDLLVIANAFEMYQAAGGSGNPAYMYQNEAQDRAAKIRVKYDPDYIKNNAYDYTHGGRYDPDSVEPMPGPPSHKTWTRLTTVEEQDGNQDVQASGEGDTAGEPSPDDLLNAVLTPKQREQKEEITNLILGFKLPAA